MPKQKTKRKSEKSVDPSCSAGSRRETSELTPTSSFREVDTDEPLQRRLSGKLRGKALR
jgi:hypothetical protein